MEDTAMVQQHNGNDDLSATDDLPFHPGLVHPRTGAPIQALGRRKDGSLIWPVHGGNGDEDENDPDDDEGATPDDNDGGTDEQDDETKEILANPAAFLKAHRERKETLAELRRENRELRKATKPAAPKQRPAQEDGPSESEKRLDAQLQRLANREWTTAVRAAAKDAGADVDLLEPLLAKARKDLQDEDGNVDEEDLADKVKDLLRRKPQIAGRKARAPSGRDQGAASTNGNDNPKTGQLTMAQWRKLPPAERLKAHSEGRLKDALKTYRYTPGQKV